jgi:DNA-directed RNA polymerase subunit RPC12/RpoP
MALIHCSECNKEVSDKASSCPNCGSPINSISEEPEVMACPRCKSIHLHYDKKGFSGRKALVGGVLTGGIGLLAGTIGSNKIRITCLKCGKKFYSGEALMISPKEAKSKENKSTPGTEQQNKGCVTAILIVFIISIITIFAI